MSGSLEARLISGLRELGEEPSSHPCHRYLAYIDLLARWNRVYNLSGIRDAERMLSHHLLDSLSLLPFLRGDFCLDAGTGAGLPGLILALARPDVGWVLLDSSRKRIRFLNQAVTELGAVNAAPVQARVEEYQSRRPFTTIVSRAFGTLSEFHGKTRHLLAPGGLFLAMKGAKPDAELPAAGAGACRIAVHRLRVPGVRAGRTVVQVEPCGNP